MGGPDPDPPGGWVVRLGEGLVLAGLDDADPEVDADVGADADADADADVDTRFTVTSAEPALRRADAAVCSALAAKRSLGAEDGTVAEYVTTSDHGRGTTNGRPGGGILRPLIVIVIAVGSAVSTPDPHAVHVV